MSGNICTDSGGKTFQVENCSDLAPGAKDAGDAYGLFCEVPAKTRKGEDAWAVVDRKGQVATYDDSTTSDDLGAGLVYFDNPNGGLRVGVSGLSVADQKATLGNADKNLSSFELCTNETDLYKTLITYTDGRTAEIDSKQKTGKGELVFLSPDGKSSRRINGLSGEQIALVTALQGAELGSCNGSKAFGTSYAVLPTRTGAGAAISWTLEDLTYFKSRLGGTSGRAFFCANSQDGEIGPDGKPVPTIGINTDESYSGVLHPLVESLVKGDCGSLSAEKCAAASAALRVYAPDVQTFWEKYSAWAVISVVGSVIAGTAFALTGRWFGGGGGRGGSPQQIGEAAVAAVLKAQKIAAESKSAEVAPLLKELREAEGPGELPLVPLVTSLPVFVPAY